LWNLQRPKNPDDYITNLFFKAEINTTIKDIEANIDEIETQLTLDRPSSLLLLLLRAGFCHYQKDFKTIIQDGPRCDLHRTGTDGAGHWYSGKYSSYELGTTPVTHPRNQQRADNPHPVSHNKQTKQIAKRKAIGKI
jgi:hypothetical protein